MNIHINGKLKQIDSVQNKLSISLYGHYAHAMLTSENSDSYVFTGKYDWCNINDDKGMSIDIYT